MKLRNLFGSLLILLNVAGPGSGVEGSLFSSRPLLESEFLAESSVAEQDGGLEETEETAAEEDTAGLLPDHDGSRVGEASVYRGPAAPGLSGVLLPVLEKRLSCVFRFSGSPRAPPICA